MGWRRGQAYGQDLRDRVLAADGSIREVARCFAVSESYVARARARQQRGQVSAGVQCNHVPRRLQGLEGALIERVATAPEQTLAQWCQRVEAEHDVRVSLATMWKTLRRLGLTLKKSHSRPPSSNGPPGPPSDPASTCAVWCFSTRPGRPRT